jgi:hypothetical protein
MNRNTTRLALAGKCGSLGVSGPSAWSPRAVSSPRSWARAIEPSPTPHSRRNHLRAVNFGLCPTFRWA